MVALHWEALFAHLHIAVSDSTRYVSKEYLGLRCPWCSDNGFHLGVHREHGYWHCFRCSASGRSPWWLLKGLGVPTREMDDLVRNYTRSNSRQPATSSAPEHRERPPLAQQRWHSFTSAADNPEVLAYLRRRGFSEETTRTFDLRAGAHRYSGRVWFKLTDLQGQILGITGRRIRDGSWPGPRYYTEAPQPMLYIPTPGNRAPITQHHRLCLICEGPMDALRVADAAQRRRHLLVVALCGLTTTGERRLQLSQIARMVPSFAFACDADTPEHVAAKLVAELRALPAVAKITRFRLPDEVKDPAELTDNQITRWLSSL